MIVEILFLEDRRRLERMHRLRMRRISSSRSIDNDRTVPCETRSNGTVNRRMRDLTRAQQVRDEMIDRQRESFVIDDR